MRKPLRPVIAASAVVAVAVVARAATVAGLELYSDEAYYWLWSRRPALGYFDHPPLTAWLIGASTAVFPGEWGVRLPFLVCGGLAVLFAGLAARELSDHPRAPLYAAILAAASPLLHLTGALALPDAPLVAAYGAAVWLLAGARGGRWCAAGLAVGLALLAKYSAALLAPALLLLLLWDPELRAALRTRWPWLGALVAVAVFAPTLAWDAAHGFASIGFQLHHGFRSGATLRSFAEFVGAQLGGAGPVLLVVGVLACLGARTPAWKRVAAASLLPLLVPIYSAMRGDPEVNWTIHAFPGLAATAGAWLAGRRHGGKAVAASVAVAALAVAGFAVVVHSSRFAETTTYYRFHGWKDAAVQARREADDLCRLASPPCDPADPFVLPTTYRLAPISYYAGWTRLGTGVGRASQLDLWAEKPRPGEPVLVLSESDWSLGVARQKLQQLEPLAPERRISARERHVVVREVLLAIFRQRP